MIHICVYIYIYTCMCIHVHIYIYTRHCLSGPRLEAKSAASRMRCTWAAGYYTYVSLTKNTDICITY